MNSSAGNSQHAFIAEIRSLNLASKKLKSPTRKNNLSPRKMEVNKTAKSKHLCNLSSSLGSQIAETMNPSES